MIEFAYPWVFILTVLPFIINRAPLYYISKRMALRISFKEDIDAAMESRQEVSGISRATKGEKFLLFILYVLVLSALAKPNLIGEPVTKDVSQRELLISVDLSGSMMTKDFVNKEGKAIDRLEAVKMVLRDFLKERKGEKIGLILFGNAAFVQAPFTQDLDALEHLLDSLRVGMAGPQTAMGDSIGLAVKMFRESNVTDRMLIVMSDGDDTGSKVPPKTSAELAAKNGVNVFTIGIGDPKNAGEHPIDTDTLKEIAAITGGKFYYAWNLDDLQDIYKQIDKLKPKEIKVLSYRPVKELFAYPLLAAILLLLLQGAWVFWQHKRRGA
ncbi:VWA domain-containing protein [Sulfurovum sp. NBC37-1]|uniref:VWA domain-containing protein n=1 Tax=Sulfurovum sp. (strain NBC37-1) TaxID=387093 RepID=UPI0001587AB7|nr:VWA domain-containing protein [Sulfurovum sp. NBC37-1]BAF73325.1 von Willebrand factor type A domain protein [Sulfurovum sp. NBC37-1]